MSQLAVASTPTVRQFFRRSAFWIGAAVFVLAASLVLVVVNGGGQSVDSGALSITNAGPGGSKALAEVLRQQGVSVSAATTLDEAVAAARDGSSAGTGTGTGTTLVVYDPNGYLPTDRQAELIGVSDRLVLIDPGVFELGDLAPGVGAAGSVDTSAPLTAGCSLPAAQRAETITAAGSTYRVTGAGQISSSGCFESYGDAYSVVRVTEAGHPVTVVGSTEVFDNEHIVDAGNAALALGVLGEGSRVVWYVASAADVTADGAPSLGQLTPDWVTPLILLLIAVFVAAAVWRGRRLGPVVVENLPVIVRGSETVDGRARLYARSGARSRALDALRVGTLSRLAGLLGLPRRASVDDIVAAVGEATGQKADGIAATLLRTVPSSEAQLVELSTRLIELENAVRLALGRPATPASPVSYTHL
ncbi:DUF4350 domain-containing protein, partial [Subtercola sp. RTI3]|uniref:DUF4350 domain-containing protein n=1 Tax=Subtercola sp. RTI3 TaxID=3048639 RepID=UPI002B23658E